MTKLSLADHGATELFGGLATMAAPFVFGFHTAAAILAIVLGGVLVALAFGVMGPAIPSLNAHRNADRLFAVVTSLVAIVLALDGDVRATLFFAVLVALHAALATRTRYASAE